MYLILLPTFTFLKLLYYLAGLDGIKNKLDPGDPVEENVYKLSPEKKREYKIGSLPVSLKGALDSFKSDQKFLEEVFTKDFLEKYCELKYQENTSHLPKPQLLGKYQCMQTHKTKQNQN